MSTKTKKLTPAFLYARVSSRGQSRTSKDGLPRQERTVREYADAHGYEIVKVYADAMSGTTEHRPQLQEMLYSLKNNGHGVTTVIIETLNRLSRTLITQESIIRDFKKYNVKLISVKEGEDLLDDDPSRTLIRNIFGSIAQYDKETIVEKLKVSRDRKKIENGGKCEGQKNYLEIIGGDKIIKRIKQLRKKDKYGRKTTTFKEIADTLNAEGFATKKNLPFTMANVANIYHRYTK